VLRSFENTDYIFDYRRSFCQGKSRPARSSKEHRPSPRPSVTGGSSRCRPSLFGTPPGWSFDRAPPRGRGSRACATPTAPRVSATGHRTCRTGTVPDHCSGA